MAGMMRKAQRRKAKLRLGLSGPAGSGKTMGALLQAYGITGNWEDICLIDSENFSGDLYANYSKNGIEIGEYNVISLTAPYTPKKYIAAIKECESTDIKCIIIDSLTHAWAGVGGLLDKKGQIEKSNKPGVNSWTAWRDITPMHNNLVDAILSSKCHIIATLRAKMEHVQEKDPVTGRAVVRKIGMNPIQRDGMEYEFTTFIDIDQDHQCTSSKDRTSIVDGRVFQLTIDLGRQFLQWLESGVDAPPPAPPQTAPPPQTQPPASRQPANGGTGSQQAGNNTGNSGNGTSLNWGGFWKSAGGLGYDDHMVKDVARTLFNKPDLVSLTEVITTQKQLNDLLGHLAKQAKEKAGAA